jgi:hypothetical protein
MRVLPRSMPLLLDLSAPSPPPGLPLVFSVLLTMLLLPLSNLLIRKTGDNTANRRPLCTDDVDAQEEAGAVVVLRLSERGALQDSG